jgi:hypothetical protein
VPKHVGDSLTPNVYVLWCMQIWFYKLISMRFSVYIVLKLKQLILKLLRILTIDKTSTYSMELSPSCKANRFSNSQEIPRILWNPNVQYTRWMYITTWNLRESWNQSKEESSHQFFKHLFWHRYVLALGVCVKFVSLTIFRSICYVITAETGTCIA